MNTALSPQSNNPISPASLADLLGADGLPYEALGAGVRDSLECLAFAREFYALPEQLGPGLDRFAGYLREALQALAETRGEAGLAADPQQ